MDHETVSERIKDFTEKANKIADPQFTSAIMTVGYLGLLVEQIADLQKTLDQINEDVSELD